PIIFLLAAIYFLVDAIFLTVAKPLGNWIAEHWITESLRVWIVSLSPYPALSLFALPLVILEPVKPIAAYLVGTGHIVTGLITLIVGEILKLVLVERLFSISRDKLISIPAFAWAYFKYCAAKDSVTSMEAWQVVRRWSVIAKYLIRSYALKLRAVQSLHRVNLQSR
ncbi:MAG: hypothetical protein P4M02_05760, partial [Clostridia bacterium]|nr:hypothetical protein [Clostridia bacterium]